MSVASEPHFILPIYQGTLNRAIQAVLARFNEGANIGAWIALETLYRILAPVVKNRVKKQYEDIKRKMQRAKQRTQNYDPLVEQENQAEEVTRICRVNNGVFFEKIMLELHNEGYLEKKPVTPRFKHTTKLEAS